MTGVVLLREWSDPPVKKVYAVSQRMIIALAASSFMAGMLVSWNLFY